MDRLAPGLRLRFQAIIIYVNHNTQLLCGRIHEADIGARQASSSNHICICSFRGNRAENCSARDIVSDKEWRSFTAIFKISTIMIEHILSSKNIFLSRDKGHFSGFHILVLKSFFFFDRDSPEIIFISLILCGWS